VLVQSTGTLTMIHSTVASNGTGVQSLSSEVEVEQSIVCGNTTDLSGVPCSAIRFSDVCGTDCGGSGGIDCQGAEGNLSVDPSFEDPSSGNYRLPWTSPAVDAGTAPECFDGLPCHDFEGRPRLLDADGDGAARADMGAFELDRPGIVVPEPDDVPNLVVAPVGGETQALSWDPETGSIEYHVYEGVLSSLGSSPEWLCLATVAGPPFALPTILPTPGDAFVYVVSGDDGIEEGTLGFGTCAERSNTVDPCP
jgi:hypothetical protein